MLKRQICFKGGLVVACVVGATAHADVIVYEDFEDATVTYTTNQAEFSDGSGDFFTRSDGSNITSSIEYSGIPSGSSFFTAMDIDGDGSLPGIQTFSTSITGFTDLSFSAFFAEDDDGSNNDWDEPDFVHIDYQIDGGGYTSLIWIENDGGQFNSAPFIDTDFDGTGDGTEITDTFAEFSSSIAGTGDTLDVRITYSLNSGDEDFAIDDVTIEGVIPEPASLALIGLGGLMMFGRGWRQN